MGENTKTLKKTDQDALTTKHGKTPTTSVLSISFKVDFPTGQVGSSLLFERQRRKLPSWVWGMLGNAILTIFQTVFGP